MANRFGITTKMGLREKAEELIKEYNAGIQEGNFAPTIEVPKADASGNPAQGTEIVLIRECVEQLVNEYTAIAREECFAALKSKDDPMLEAVKVLFFDTIRIVDKKVGDDKQKVPVSSIEDAQKPIDLLKLHKYVGGDGIGQNKNWAYMVEKLNFLMTAQKAIDLGIDPKEVHDSYAMSDISKQIDLGKTPTSKTNILKTLQAIVNAMVGEEYKATSHDVNFLMSVYSRKNRAALTVTCANHKYMRQYLAEICHRIVLGKSYAIDYKKAKK